MATAATKIAVSTLDMRQIAHPPLCTNRHKIKAGMKNCKYIYAGPSRGPRINSRPQKDPDDRCGWFAIFDGPHQRHPCGSCFVVPPVPDVVDLANGNHRHHQCTEVAADDEANSQSAEKIHDTPPVSAPPRRCIIQRY